MAEREARQGSDGTWAGGGQKLSRLGDRFSSALLWNEGRGTLDQGSYTSPNSKHITLCSQNSLSLKYLCPPIAICVGK